MWLRYLWSNKWKTPGVCASKSDKGVSHKRNIMQRGNMRDDEHQQSDQQVSHLL